MKLRKILARSVAIASCFAMLSTSVFAASELTLTTAKDADKIKTTIAGAVGGQVTFLAVNAGTTLSDTTAPADMQYIDQQTKEAGEDVVISFAKRASGSNTVDLYAGGESVTEVAILNGIAAAEAAAITGTTTFEVESNAVPATDAEWLAWLQGKVSVSYTELGSTAPTTVTLSAANASDFAVVATAGTGSHTIAVTYKGMAAGNVTVTETAPLAPITGITVTGIGGAIDIFVDSALDEDTAIAKAQEVDITVTANRNDSSTTPVTGYTYQWNAADQTVEIVYGEFTAAEKFTFNPIVRAYASVETSTANLRFDLEDLNVAELTEVTTTVVENAVKALIGTTTFAPEYVWNDSSIANAAIPSTNFEYATTEGAGTADAKSFTVAITLKEAAGNIPAGTSLGSITVTVASAANRTVITGSVTVADTTGEVTGFGATLPVGAIVTAIKVSDEGNGGNFTADGYESYADVVDASGNFELEVPAGEYKVYVAHAKYEFFEGDLYISRTIKEEHDVTIEDGEEVELGALALKYAFFGDTDLDGDVDGDDYANFAPKFGTSIN